MRKYNKNFKFDNVFDLSNINNIDLNLKEAWSIPPRDLTNSITFVSYDSIVSNNIRTFNQKFEYETNNGEYLRSLLKDIEETIGQPVPYSVLNQGRGFAYPSHKSLDINAVGAYTVIANEPDCKKFMKELVNFPPNESNDNAVLTPYYLLGYVGSGKTSFNRFFQTVNQDALQENIYINLTYEMLEKEIEENQNKSQYEWDEIVYELIDELLISSYSNKSDYEKKIEIHNSPNDLVINELMNTYNILTCIDGFDSLTVRAINESTIQKVLTSIANYLRNLRRKYGAYQIKGKACNVLISLRKCTYESLNKHQKVRKNNSYKSYWLQASTFKNVLLEAVNTLLSNGAPESSGKHLFYEAHQEKIKEILEITSDKIDAYLKHGFNDEDCPFDRNYRRRLRYIACLIYRSSSKITYQLCARSSARGNLDDLFFIELKKDLEGMQNYYFQDILVYGSNTGFNNHFPYLGGDDTPDTSAKCGFVDNVFWYISEKPKGEIDPLRFLTMIRILQILAHNKQYMSVSEIRSTLNDMGHSNNNESVLKFLKYLELDLFARSNRTEATLAGNEVEVIRYKCSNFGLVFIKKVLFSYSYISGVAQTTCLPKEIVSKVIYKKRQLNSQGYIFTDQWKSVSVVNVVYFLRVLRTIEKKYEKLSEKYKNFSLSARMIKECKFAVGAIINSEHSGLSDKEKKAIHNGCNQALNFQ